MIFRCEEFASGGSEGVARNDTGSFLFQHPINFKTVFLWDPSSGEVYRILPGHTSFVVGVAFSPDGKTLASASLDGTILLWDQEAALGPIFLGSFLMAVSAVVTGLVVGCFV